MLDELFSQIGNKLTAITHYGKDIQITNKPWNVYGCKLQTAESGSKDDLHGEGESLEEALKMLINKLNQ